MGESGKNHYLVFKTELRVSNSQRSYFISHFGATRFAYNCLLNWTIEEWEKHKADPTHPRPSLTYQSLQKVWRQELRDQYAPWYRENSKDPYEHAAMALALAYKGFFTRSERGHPKWKRRGQKVAYSTRGALLRFDGASIQVPRLGDVRLHEKLKAAAWLEKMGGHHVDSTFSQDATGRIYISLRYRVVDKLALAFFRGKLSRKGSGFVGVDLGLKEFGVISDGTVISNPRYYRKLEAKLARAQRQLANKKVAKRRANGQAKGDSTDWDNHSSSHDRARKRVARLNRRVRNQRREFLNQTARELVSKNSTVVIEDLNVEGMKSKFGKSVSDASPAEFRRILTYMAERYGTQIIVADRYFPSTQICSYCGAQAKIKLALSVRTYTCEACGLTLARDLNAARNLEKWGLDYLASQDALRCSESLNGRGTEDLIASDHLDARRRSPEISPSMLPMSL